jgi:hypothetical protein
MIIAHRNVFQIAAKGPIVAVPIHRAHLVYHLSYADVLYNLIVDHRWSVAVVVRKWPIHRDEVPALTNEGDRAISWS